MQIGYLSILVLFGIALYACQVQAEDAEVHIVSSGYCSSEFLKKKGVDPSKYKRKVIFDPKKITTIPAKPTVPGCFRLIAHNVTLTEHLSALTGEFEMRVASTPDPSKPCLQCKKKQPKCGCGEKDACMYCDFCKNWKKWWKDGKVNNKHVDEGAAPSQCGCDVEPGTYTIDAEVCTPDDKELGENVPTEVLDEVADHDSFNLVTAVYIYDFRYNSLSNADNSDAAAKALKARKAKGLIGCYIVGANVSV